MVSVICNAQNLDKKAKSLPNIILNMADDLGWGDVGFNGNQEIKTPYLDKMAKNSLQFNRFYAAAPVCSPTRGSCLTGRHPERYGIPFANSGHMKEEEIILAEVLKTQGYTTGHFGKWHLGTLTKDMEDGRRGGRQNEHYSPPWENGFDASFSTEVQMPTWNPGKNQAFPSKYWTGPGEFATDNLEGDDARVIMDRAIPFMEQATYENTPFFSVIWFHTPHEPVIAGPEYLKMYSQYSEDKQHYYGCITAMDEQIGRLRKTLKQLKIDKNTLIFFTSDNGPAGEGGGTKQQPGKRQQGTAGPYRGRKGSLYEGGIRVPGLLEWPAMIKKHRETDYLANTSDYFPTVLDMLNAQIEEQVEPVDGISLLPLVKGKVSERPQPIGFYSQKQQAWNDNHYKIYSADRGTTYELYDMQQDPYEQNNIAADHPEIVDKMKKELERWIASCKRSEQGEDY